MDLTKALQSGFSPEMRKKIWNYITTPLTDKQRDDFRQGMIAKGLQFPNEEFDDKGLKFDISYLNRIGGAVCMFPLEFMAEYVDKVCKTSMDNEEGLMEQDILSDDVTDKSLQGTDATGLGNIAYIILHTKDDMVKAKCLDTLWRYLNFYFDFLMNVMMAQAKERPIQ